MGLMYICYHDTPVGSLILGVYEDKLCLADWVHRKNRAKIDHRIKQKLGVTYKKKIDPLHKEAIDQIDAYFKGTLQEFSIPLLPIATSFELQVLKAVSSVGYAQKATYKQIADAIHKPKAVRAVANAIGANALSLFIPCHRIVASNGGTGGYAGGIEAKEVLLKIERGTI